MVEHAWAVYGASAIGQPIPLILKGHVQGHVHDLPWSFPMTYGLESQCCFPQGQKVDTTL